MSDVSISLSKIYEGWEGYNTSILHAIHPLTNEQLTWRPSDKLRSVGELASHIALGRIGWFARMPAPGSLELLTRAGALGSEAAIAGNKDEIVHWLQDSWQVIAGTLSQWTLDDLWRTFEQDYQGVNYKVSYQWVIWRILAHDIHHGGELAVLLGMQGIEIPELGDLGGHITMPPITDKP